MTWPWNYLYLFGVKSIYFKLEWKFTFSWVVRLEKLMQDVFEEVVMEGLTSLQKERADWRELRCGNSLKVSDAYVTIPKS